MTSSWVTHAWAERHNAERRLETATAGHAHQPGRDEIEELIDGLGGIAATLGDADPDEKNRLYAGLGLTLTYQPGETK